MVERETYPWDKKDVKKTVKKIFISRGRGGGGGRGGVGRAGVPELLLLLWPLLGCLDEGLDEQGVLGDPAEGGRVTLQAKKNWGKTLKNVSLLCMIFTSRLFI